MTTVKDFMLKIREVFSIETLSSEEACRSWFLHELNPAGALCPGCELEITNERKLASYWSLKRVTCSGCNRTFSAVSDSVLNGLGIDFRVLYLLLFLVGSGVNANKFYRQLGISSGAAYIWQNKTKAVDQGALQQTVAGGESSKQ
jgi:hypothetical protein